MNRFAIINTVLILLTLAGCKDTIRIIDDVYECTTVKVDGNTLDVVAFPGLGTIGYWSNGLVPHSGCTPALIDSALGATRYRYYQHGQPANSKEGVNALTFWRSNDGNAMLNATRLAQNGVVTREDGRLKNIQLMEWQEWFGNVVAQHEYNGSKEHSVKVEVGENSKERRWDENTQQWQCVYREQGGIVEIALECEDEEYNDTKYLGLSAHCYLI
ncbi:hypothetical protein JCM19233_1795 [Vibrio astriarenae]|nr:hypothetical protein JCM19233_1795 [Vibrio sp. C7]